MFPHTKKKEKNPTKPEREKKGEKNPVDNL